RRESNGAHRMAVCQFWQALIRGRLPQLHDAQPAAQGHQPRAPGYKGVVRLPVTHVAYLQGRRLRPCAKVPDADLATTPPFRAAAAGGDRRAARINRQAGDEAGPRRQPAAVRKVGDRGEIQLSRETHALLAGGKVPGADAVVTSNRSNASAIGRKSNSR